MDFADGPDQEREVTPIGKERRLRQHSLPERPVGLVKPLRRSATCSGDAVQTFGEAARKDDGPVHRPRAAAELFESCVDVPYSAAHEIDALEDAVAHESNRTSALRP